MSNQDPITVLEPGQSVFKVNIETGEVEKARFTLIKGRNNKTSARYKEIAGFINIPAYNKAHAKKKYDAIIAKAKAICSVCGGEGLKLVKCLRCENNHCDNCQAVYNQHTQIDFDCCKTCAAKYEE